MKVLKKVTPQDFPEHVSYYQERVYYSSRGKAIQRAAERELTLEQVTYIHAVMVVSDRDLIDLGMGFVEMPVDLLFTLMTQCPVEAYKQKESQLYMVGVTERCVKDMSSLVIATSYSKGQCRKFALAKHFVSLYYNAQQELLAGTTIISTPHSPGVLEYGLTMSPRGAGFEHVNRLHTYTVATIEKLQNSQFRFDADYFHSRDGKDFIRSHKLTNSQIDSLNCALEFINKYTKEPQYHGSFHLQQAGRMHTVGGCIQMPKWFRDTFILPVDPNNVRVELDLKCAQLLILCDILQLKALKERILNILDEDGSIWPSIGSPHLDKRIKKVIVYAFCYGGELKSLPFLASKEARMKGLPFSVKQQQVDECLDGLLAPLVEARETWLQHYTVERIIKSRGERKPKNDLGYPFPLYQTAAELGENLTGKKLQSTKVGSRYLAHLAQGQEQYVIQNLIANYIGQNILTFQYDGLTLEVQPQQVNLFISRVRAASTYPLEVEIQTVEEGIQGRTKVNQEVLIH